LFQTLKNLLQKGSYPGMEYPLCRIVSAAWNIGSAAANWVTFTGICRGAEAGEPIAALTLEHYPGMAEAEIARSSRACCSS
jgi:molybdopterin synthase catalytic subunit